MCFIRFFPNVFQQYINVKEHNLNTKNDDVINMMWKNSQLKTYLLLGVVVTSIILAAVALSPPGKGYTYDLKTFSSYDDLLDFLNERYENYDEYGWYGDGDPRMAMAEDGAKAPSGESNAAGGTDVDFSETNIQVTGVDEPDIVKTDGTYLYIVAGSKIVIVKAYPADKAVVLSEISLGDSQNPVNIFINGDRLVVFSEVYGTYQSDDIKNMYGWWGVSKTVISIFDVSDIEHPMVDKEIKVDGGYFDSRMIGEYVYVIISEYSSDIYRNVDGNITLCIPELTIDDETEQIPADQIYYIDVPELSDTMTHVLSINIQDGEVNQKSFMLGSSQSMYVSKNNIFLAYLHYEYIYPILESEPGENIQTTILHKISIDAEDISYAAQGEVPGMILNQFSMDEHDRYFRIATTSGSVWGGESTNNIYILDEDLKRVSEIENIAPGETIYSARFMGSKAYLVTFKKIDPFFTIDLSDPKSPQILGELKIPGYSDYLHPYDENHIIGIGKDTVEPQEEQSWTWNFAWYQGIKIALFDVSDFENPKEVTKIIIGDRGTDSPALYDHKAFLFDKEKEILVIPVRLCEISDEIKEQNDGYTGNIYGECTFQGAYVYKLNLDDGFEYTGRITHGDGEIYDDYGWGYWGSSTITRTLYIEDVLYTISESMVKMNDLQTLSEINSVSLG
jgi:uncharacterized secreted protein with C-terminal beta-propeller domain